MHLFGKFVFTLLVFTSISIQAQPTNQKLQKSSLKKIHDEYIIKYDSPKNLETVSIGKPISELMADTNPVNGCILSYMNPKFSFNPKDPDESPNPDTPILNISGSPTTSTKDNLAYSFIPTYDYNGNTNDLKFSIENKPDWAAFDYFSGRLYGAPFPGMYNDIKISITDGISTAILPSFNISVSNESYPDNGKLEGIDANSDGVRDDIEDLITMLAQGDVDQKVYLTHAAKQLRNILNNELNSSQLLYHSELSKAQACTSDQYSEYAYNRVFARALDSKDRYLKYVNSSSTLSKYSIDVDKYECVLEPTVINESVCGKAKSFCTGQPKLDNF